MKNQPEMVALRYRIADGLKGDTRMLDFKCTDCGVGINNGSETFVITPDSIEIWCESCRKEHDA